MANFVYDSLTPFETKLDPTPGTPPDGYATNQALLPGDWNKAATALTDIRANMRGDGPKNVKHYGALGNDATTDVDVTAIQAAVDAAGTGGSVYLPPGTYFLTKPIVINKPGVRLYGDHRGTTKLRKTSLGPAVIFGPEWGGLPLEDPLATGISGSKSWKTDLIGGGGNPQYLNLRADNDYLALLDGTSAFTFECYYREPPGRANAPVISTAKGQRHLSEGETADIFMSLSVGALGAWNMEVGIQSGAGGISVSTSGGAVVADTTYHLAVVYNGSAARLYVNGVQRLNASLSGPLRFPKYMQWFLGGAQRSWPEVGYSDSGYGLIDSVRISNTARYTSGFTAPTAKLTADTNTLFLLNFDDNKDAYTTASVGYNGVNLKQHLPLREGVNQPWPGISGVALDNLTIEGGGVLAQRCPNSSFTRLTGTGGGYGLWLKDLCLGSRVEDCEFTQGATSQFCVCVSQSSDAGSLSERVTLQNLRLDGAGVAALAAASAKIVLKDSSIEGHGLTAIFAGDGNSDLHHEVVASSCKFFDNSGSGVETIILTDNYHLTQFTNCDIFNLADGAPPPLLTVGGDLGPLILTECLYHSAGSAPENIHHLLTGPPTQRAYLKGIRFLVVGDPGPTVWSETAGYVVIVDRGTP